MNDVLMENALQLRRNGNLAEAARIYDEVLRADPRHFGALHALGLLRYQAGQLEEAERLIGAAIAVNPRAADALYNRGSLLLRLGRFQEAADCLTQAIAVRPDYVEALTNRGRARMELGRESEALDDFKRAAQLRPTIAEVWMNLGAAFAKAGRHGEARDSWDKALALKPQLADLWMLRGRASVALGSLDEAVASYDRVLQLRPGDKTALCARADAFLLSRRFAEAERDYETLLGDDPHLKYVRGNLVFCRLHSCDWRSLNSDRELIRSGVRLGRPVVAPFPSLVICNWPEGSSDLVAAARMWTQDQYPTAPVPLWRGERYGHERIRLAYVSANFGDHPVARLIAGVFEHHDRSRFETVAVSLDGNSESAIRRRLMASFDRFVHVHGSSDVAIARQIRDMEIDIAVDLMGFTDGCRPGIFAMRPAPIQVNYLGFPGSMGANYIDYIFGDATVMPDTERENENYSEKIVRLPDCYLPHDRKRAIAPSTPSRAEAGLPEMGFVFCCFNNSYKYTPEVFDVWMRLLRAIPDSVLWLPQLAPAAAANLAREAEARGVSARRLVRAPYLTSAEAHLARLRLADLFLDTLPYNAHATANDALWAGVPVLTCMGHTFPGRVAASLLHAIGLPEMVTESLDAYEAVALRLARDPEALRAIREKLAENRNHCSLFDTSRFTHNLERAFLEMWQRYRRGEEPGSFAVSAAGKEQ